MESIFTPATNTSAFLKMGIYGGPGPGKTFDACQIAIGLHKYTKATKPVKFLDTETGSNWAMPVFKAAGVPLETAKTRAFVHLVAAMKEAESEGSILIVDSLTHFWEEVQDAYIKTKKIKYDLQFHHWKDIKKTWAQYTDAFTNGAMHCIVCGRSAWEYEDQVNQRGKTQKVRVGTKMKAETDFTYEPSLVLELERERTETGKGASTRHVAYVLKDRRMDGKSMDGQSFIFKAGDPTGKIFDTFIPHIEYLNIGGQHVGVGEATSDDMFEGKNGEDWHNTQRQKARFWGEIEGELKMAFPGSTKDEKVAKAAILKCVFDSYEPETVADMDPRVLHEGHQHIVAICQDLSEVQRCIDTAKAHEKWEPKPKAEDDMPFDGAPAPNPKTKCFQCGKVRDDLVELDGEMVCPGKGCEGDEKA